MAYLDDLDPSLDYDAQELALKQAEARIAALRGMKAPQLPGQTTGFQSAVTGTQVAGPVPKMKFGSYLGQAAPLLADYTAGRMQDEVLQRRTQLDAQQEADILRTIGEQPKGLGPTPALDAQGNPTSQMLPPVPPTLEANLKWGQKLSRFPKTRSLGGDYMKDQLIEEGKREQARQLEMYKLLYGSQEKKLDRANTLEAARIRAAPKGASVVRPVNLGGGQMAVADETAPNGWRVVGERKEPIPRNMQYLGPNPNATGDHDAGLWFDASSREGTPVPGPLKPDKLPVGMGEKFMANNAAIGQVDQLARLLNTPEGRNALGPTRSTLSRIPGPYGEWVLNNWIDSKGTVTRAMVSAIGNTKLHDLSGATVTVGEEARFKPYIPAVGDSYQTALFKLAGFRQEYMRAQKEYIDYAKAQGYRLPGKAPEVPMEEVPAAPENQIPGGVPGQPGPAAPAAPAASGVRRKVWNKNKGDWE